MDDPKPLELFRFGNERWACVHRVIQPGKIAAVYFDGCNYVVDTFVRSGDEWTSADPNDLGRHVDDEAKYHSCRRTLDEAGHGRR